VHACNDRCWSFVVRYSPPANVTLTTQADDEFIMFDEDISVKVPSSITSLLHGFKGERYHV